MHHGVSLARRPEKALGNIDRSKMRQDQFLGLEFRRKAVPEPANCDSQYVLHSDRSTLYSKQRVLEFERSFPEHLHLFGQGGG